YAAAALLGAALDLGVPTILTRRVARAPEAGTREWAAAAVLKLGLLGPAGLVDGLLAALTPIPAATRVALSLLRLPPRLQPLVFQSFVELGAAVFAARQAVHWEFVVRLVEKVVLVGIGFVWLWHGGGLVAVCGAFVLAGLASLAATLVVLQRPGAPFAWRRAP